MSSFAKKFILIGSNNQQRLGFINKIEKKVEEERIEPAESAVIFRSVSIQGEEYCFFVDVPSTLFSQSIRQNFDSQAVILLIGTQHLDIQTNLSLIKNYCSFIKAQLVNYSVKEDCLAKLILVSYPEPPQQLTENTIDTFGAQVKNSCKQELKRLSVYMTSQFIERLVINKLIQWKIFSGENMEEKIVKEMRHQLFSGHYNEKIAQSNINVEQMMNHTQLLVQPKKSCPFCSIC